MSLMHWEEDLDRAHSIECSKRDISLPQVSGRRWDQHRVPRIVGYNVSVNPGDEELRSEA